MIPVLEYATKPDRRRWIWICGFAALPIGVLLLATGIFLVGPQVCIFFFEHPRDMFEYGLVLKHWRYRTSLASEYCLSASVVLFLILCIASSIPLFRRRLANASGLWFFILACDFIILCCVLVGGVLFSVKR
jgi:hypothetical protein